MSDLAGRLRQAIGNRPVDEVARTAGIGRITLRDILRRRGKRGPYLDTIVALARALKVRPAWIAWGDGQAEESADG